MGNELKQIIDNYNRVSTEYREVMCKRISEIKGFLSEELEKSNLSQHNTSLNDYISFRSNEDNIECEINTFIDKDNSKIEVTGVVNNSYFYYNQCNIYDDMGVVKNVIRKVIRKTIQTKDNLEENI